MKILFLHLSDIHIIDENSFNKNNINKIVKTLNKITKIDKLILILSGDIANSGSKSEYDIAEEMINYLTTQIKKLNIYTGKIDILCVPGNHDVHHEIIRDSKYLNKIYKNNEYESHLDEEIAKEENFFNFAKKYDCFTDNNFCCRKILNYGQYKIEANLINTAPFSLRKEESKGLHYLSEEYINSLNDFTGCDFVLSIMHHSYDWFIDYQKNQLKDTILNKSSILFMGHEHYLNTSKLTSTSGQTTILNTSGELCVKSNWESSAYNISILDSNTNEYTVYFCKWDKDNNYYSCDQEFQELLPFKPSIDNEFIVKDEFKNKLLMENKFSFSNNLKEYFVFPRLYFNDINKNSKYIVNMDSFIKEILDKKKVIINGDSESGKTSLLKMLFLELSKEYCIIYCNIDDIRNNNTNKIIKSCFEDIYGYKTAHFKKFEQMPASKKILIIDDIDSIDSQQFTNYILSLENQFETMIFSSKKTIDFDMLEQMKNELQFNSPIYKYSITPFYLDKRKELVETILNIKNKTSDINLNDSVDKICNALTLSKEYIPLNPSFITSFIELSSDSSLLNSNKDINIFSKVFEASITSQLSPYATGKVSIDKLFRILSYIAYNIHFRKLYPITSDEINNLINNYNEENDDHIDSYKILNIFLNSGILIEYNDGYKFAVKSQFSYFVANEVNFEYFNSLDNKDIIYLLNYSCFGLNAEILLFVAYMTDNSRILQFILQQTIELTKSWDEINFEKYKPRFLNSNQYVPLEEVNSQVIEEYNNDAIEEEKELCQYLKTYDQYDYDESTSEDIPNQIIRSMSLLVLISKCFPVFEHMMKKDLKHEFINQIYVLPNKIYNTWCQLTDQSLDEYVEYFCKVSSKNYKPIPQSYVVNKVKYMAINLLLNIYNAVAICSTKENTYQNLTNFDYNSNSNYKIQHLMMTEYNQDVNLFISELEKNFYDNKDYLFNFLYRNVCRHALINMKDIKLKDQNKLNSLIQSSQSQKNNILFNRGAQKVIE